MRAIFSLEEWIPFLCHQKSILPTIQWRREVFSFGVKAAGTRNSQLYVMTRFKIGMSSVHDARSITKSTFACTIRKTTSSEPSSFIYAIISIVSVIMRLPTEVSSRDCNTSGHNTHFTSSRKRRTKQKHCSACLGSLHVTCMCVAGSHNRYGDSNRALAYSTTNIRLDTN
jgi:hypothetical protein